MPYDLEYRISKHLGLVDMANAEILCLDRFSYLLLVEIEV
jgi:hypothetical protein